ncbi:MAG: hypothetical protein H7X91_09555 [Burkholderiales bacterium]|nr:hypothetical protein [Burkholderiales bacterium]
MDTFPKLYSNIADLLAVPPEDLVPILLKFAAIAQEKQGGRFQIGFVDQLATGNHEHTPNAPRYSPLDNRKTEDHLAEAWRFIDREGFIRPDTGINGANGFKVLTARGREAADNFDAEKYSEAAAFQKALLHPMIADKVWATLARNDLNDAVFDAFRTLEIEVRAAASLSANDVGDGLMRKAFAKDGGPLTNMSDPDGERLALQHLFAGAFGVFRNSHGHRKPVTDLRDAQYQVLLASHLLRIVDARRKP